MIRELLRLVFVYTCDYVKFPQHLLAKAQEWTWMLIDPAFRHKEMNMLRRDLDI